MYRRQVREEDFGFIAATSDGVVSAYPPEAVDALREWREDELVGMRLGAAPAGYELRAPIFMTIELTLRCNLACTHCYISAGDARRDELTTADIKRLLERIRELGVFFVFLTGGEPTLRSDFVEILTHAEEVGLDVNVLTNGSGLTPHVLRAVPPDTTFVISVDGIEAHERIRKNQTFAQVARRIEAARAAGFPVVTNATINKTNLGDLPRLYDWAERERVILTSLDLYNVGRANAHADLLYLDEADIARYVAYIDRKVAYDRLLPELYEETFGGPRVFANPYYYAFSEDCIRSTGYNYQGNYYLYVAADGQVYPDNFYAGEFLYPSGQVLTEDLRDIWRRARTLVDGSNYDQFDCTGCPIDDNGWFCDFKSAVQSINATGVANECGAYGVMKELVLLRNERQAAALGGREENVALRRYDNF